MNVSSPSTRLWRMIELVAFVAVVPLLMWLYLPPRWILPFLWLVALGCYIAARRVDPSCRSGGWNRGALTRANLVPMLWRFSLCAVLMVAATILFKPALLFSFVREKPLFWALVMVAYPLVSVIAQEIIYRRYLFARFDGFLSPRMLIIVTGLAFGTVHLVFGNWVAPAMCLIGGMIFSSTYHKTRSLWLVSLEHALYGNFLFTVGLGQYFYHGAVGAGQ